MVMQYDNEYETKENKNQTKDRTEPQQLHRGIQHLLPLLPSVRVDEGETMRLELLCQVRRNRRLLF